MPVGEGCAAIKLMLDSQVFKKKLVILKLKEMVSKTKTYALSFVINILLAVSIVTLLLINTEVQSAVGGGGGSTPGSVKCYKNVTQDNNCTEDQNKCNICVLQNCSSYDTESTCIPQIR
jgi:hypothetical protein